MLSDFGIEGWCSCNSPFKGKRVSKCHETCTRADPSENIRSGFTAFLECLRHLFPFVGAGGQIRDVAEEVIEKVGGRFVEGDNKAGCGNVVKELLDTFACNSRQVFGPCRLAAVLEGVGGQFAFGDRAIGHEGFGFAFGDVGFKGFAAQALTFPRRHEFGMEVRSERDLLAKFIRRHHEARGVAELVT